MADFTFADQPIVQGSLIIPLMGTWTLDAYFEATDYVPAVGQHGTLSVLGTARAGTITRAGTEALFVRSRIVGGSGKLDALLPAKDYKSLNLSQISADCLSEAGEVVGVGWDSQDVSCPHWTRSQAPCRESLRRLVRLIDADPGVAAPGLTHWRTVSDGSVALVSETWPDNTASVDKDRLAWPQESMVEVWPLNGSLDVGQSVTAYGVARQVTRVLYQWDENEVVTSLWYV